MDSSDSTFGKFHPPLYLPTPPSFITSTPDIPTPPVFEPIFHDSQCQNRVFFSAFGEIPTYPPPIQCMFPGRYRADSFQTKVNLSQDATRCQDAHLPARSSSVVEPRAILRLFCSLLAPRYYQLGCFRCIDCREGSEDTTSGWS